MRGRPKTRSNPTYQWFVWKNVREAYAKHECTSIRQACEYFLQRAGGKLDFVAGDGAVIARVSEVLTLEQWYANVEAARQDSASDIGARCEAWEKEIDSRWPARASQAAYWRVVRDMGMRGFNLTAENYKDIDEVATSAAIKAEATVNVSRRPRKNKPR